MNEDVLTFFLPVLAVITFIMMGWFANDFVELIFDSTDAITDGARIEYLESEAFNDYCRIVLNNQVTKKIEVNCNNFRLNHQSFQKWCDNWNGYYDGYQGSIEFCWLDFNMVKLQEKEK